MRVLLHFGDASTSYGVSPGRAIEILNGKLKTRCDFVSSLPNETQEELKAKLRECDVVVGTSVTLDSAICTLFNSSPKLRLVQCMGAGIENIPLDTLSDSRVLLADASGTNSVSVAEHGFAFLLAISKMLVEKDREMKAGVWRRTPPSEVYGQTHVILGLGAIGSELARRSVAFGMKVVGIRKHPAGSPFEGCDVRGLEALHEILPTADYLTVALPLTAETRGLIGSPELSLMKRSSSIIIVSRAAVVDEKSLYEALREGRIAHAAIDTWYAVPPAPYAPSRYSIEKLDNVIASPHIAGISSRTVDRVFTLVASNIDALSSGGPITNVVDPQLGY